MQNLPGLIIQADPTCKLVIEVYTQEMEERGIGAFMIRHEIELPPPGPYANYVAVTIGKRPSAQGTDPNRKSKSQVSP